MKSKMERVMNKAYDAHKAYTELKGVSTGWSRDLKDADALSREDFARIIYDNGWMVQSYEGEVLFEAPLDDTVTWFGTIMVTDVPELYCMYLTKDGEYAIFRIKPIKIEIATRRYANGLKATAVYLEFGRHKLTYLVEYADEICMWSNAYKGKEKFNLVKRGTGEEVSPACESETIKYQVGDA